MQSNYMTPEESEVFLKDIAFAVFLEPRKYILDNSANPKATFELWALALSRSVTKDEAVQVINGWADGSIELFTYADFGKWFLAIIREAQRIRRKREAERQRAELLDSLPPREEFIRLNYNREQSTLANLEHTTRMAAKSRIEFSPHIAQLLGRS